MWKAIGSIVLSGIAAVPALGQEFHHSGKIDTTINPAGTHSVVLAPMPLRGATCDQNSVGLTVQLITRQFNQVWGRNSPEVIYLGLLSANREMFADGITLQTPQNRKQFAVITRPGPQALPRPCNQWEHRITLTRNQFLWIANAASVQADGANSGPVAFSRDHLEALRDVADRMEPEESVVKPPDPEVFAFEGDLQPGLVYSAALQYRADGAGWWPADPPLRIPAHHAMRLEWLNLADYPELAAKTSPRREFVFLVVDRKVRAMAPDRWNTTIQCKILKVR
jgi:hypothetical protein